MMISEVETAGALLYGYLHGDPSNRKLQLLSDVLLESEHDRNKVLGRAIQGYLSSHQLASEMEKRLSGEHTSGSGKGVRGNDL